ncbi:MAG: hypothetical protein MJ066_06180 [Clostridia bacterium]|nr:hypothetical protein [Clostridia bacterium]
MEDVKQESIYTVNNRYGYKLNLKHPKIRNLYERYKKWKGLTLNFPLTDKQRFEFESYLLKKLNSN